MTVSHQIQLLQIFLIWQQLFFLFTLLLALEKVFVDKLHEIAFLLVFLLLEIFVEYLPLMNALDHRHYCHIYNLNRGPDANQTVLNREKVLGFDVNERHVVDAKR